MKKLLIVLLAIVMVAAVSVPTASADRGWHHRGGGCFGCGFGLGFFSGAVVGGALAAPYYYPPPPVYVYTPPPPRCFTQPGYWSQVPYTGYNGYTTYQSVWVPPQTVCG